MPFMMSQGDKQKLCDLYNTNESDYLAFEFVQKFCNPEQLKVCQRLMKESELVSSGQHSNLYMYREERENFLYEFGVGFNGGVMFKRANNFSKQDVIGVELGVLLPPEHEEFDYYACNNPDLPFGFYDENQYAIGNLDFEEERSCVKEYVERGVEGTFGIMSEQGQTSLPDLDFYRLTYGYFKNKNEILYSVCKKDGKLVEGFLETELDKLVQNKGIEGILKAATDKSQESSSNVVDNHKDDISLS